MKYFQRHWNETRGDEFDSWGKATYVFEIDDDRRVMRQLEIYENGNVLCYDQSHPEDQYGMLAKDIDPVDLKPFEINREDFDTAWRGHTPMNYHGD